MKAKLLGVFLTLIFAFTFIIHFTPILAATEEEIETAIEKALEWLAAQQNADGSWGWGCENVA